MERAGQSVTDAAHEVMVTSAVEYTVETAPAMTEEAMKATAAMENCILIDLEGWWEGFGIR